MYKSDACIVTEPVLLGCRLSAKKFSEVIDKASRFHRQIGRRVFNAANDYKIYCPEVYMNNEIFRMKWDNDDRSIIATITEGKKSIEYVFDDSVNHLTYRSNLNVSEIGNTFCSLSFVFYG